MFKKEMYRDDGYGLFVPAAYDAAKQWPVILFLHGAGETGSDGVRPMQVGIGPAVRQREQSFPFLVVFPQSNAGTWRAGTRDADCALAILEEVEHQYNVDLDRVHLTGISMGGFGTWNLAAAEPGKWASIVPVCGGGSVWDAPDIKGIPCWAFHGDADEIIPVARSREMIGALRAAGAEPRYTEFKGVGHNSWDPAYATEELYGWLAGNRR